MRKLNLGLSELDKVVEILPKEGIVLLQGTLASGKTTLVKAIAKFYGVTKDVTSPTFSVMQSYDGDIQIFHYDIYQNGILGITSNGLFENFFEKGLHLVEWGDEELENLLKKYGLNFTKVIIKIEGNTRKYEVVSA